MLYSLPPPPPRLPCLSHFVGCRHVPAGFPAVRMCVIFSLENCIYLSISTQNACALVSSCLQCVVCRRPRAVVVLPLLGMLDGTPCGAGSCHASHPTHNSLLPPPPWPVLCQSLEPISLLLPNDLHLSRPFLYSSQPKICWPRRRNTYLSSHRGFSAPGLRGPHLPIQPRWEAFCTRSAVRVRRLATPYR